jgi:cellulose synthase/poly-beta-1,6-N-acetylglucosamine synthase-like glycosyltransferase
MFLTNTAARLLPMHDEQWSDNVLIVVPSYNEEESLPAVLDALCALVPLTSIVIVDDGSTDDTSAVAHRRVVQVVRMSGLGAR